MAFIAKFTQVLGDQFIADKNENKPYLGKVLAGAATGSIINGTMFQRDGYSAGDTMYACENVTVEVDGKSYVNTEILSKIGLLEYIELRKVLGQGKLTIAQDTNDFTEKSDSKDSEDIKTERKLKV